MGVDPVTALRRADDDTFEVRSSSANRRTTCARPTAPGQRYGESVGTTGAGSMRTLTLFTCE
jgi:hypothetical protein